MTDSMISNINLDLDGSPTDVAATLAKLLGVLDEHPDAFQINAEFKRPARTVDVSVKTRRIPEIDATSLKYLFHSEGELDEIPDASNRALAKRAITVLRTAGITTVGPLCRKTRQQLYEITGVGPHMLNLIENGLDLNFGAELAQ
jgi:DNA-directed RNA polymerase alpha subunit